MQITLFILVNSLLHHRRVSQKLTRLSLLS